jgi:hypothetical protein
VIILKHNRMHGIKFEDEIGRESSMNGGEEEFI